MKISKVAAWGMLMFVLMSLVNCSAQDEEDHTKQLQQTDDDYEA